MIKYISIENYFINRNNDKNIFIIDNNVFKNWTNKINNITGKSKYYLLESTEKNKSNDTYQKIMKFLFENNINRDYTIFGIGGGIVGDITGFVASTFMRGIKLVHIPTTLLSMVDSSIGGKTGFNTIYGKNMIGSIYPANEIIIDKLWLDTLPKKHIINGMAETIKMALLKGGELYDLINDSTPDSLKHIDRIILLSAQYKLDIIGNDNNDTKGMRELLNLGHTWGHAIELSQELLHGYAVADGIIEELKYTNYYYGFPSMTVIKNVYSMLKKWKLIDCDTKKSIHMNDINKKHELNMICYYLANDKKSDRLVSIVDIGIPKTVKFDIDKWKFLIYPSFMIKNNMINSYKTIPYNLPGSKSITNRAIICSLLKSINTNKSLVLNKILVSEDTELMINAMKQSGVCIERNINNLQITATDFNPIGTYYLGNSGTSVRFLLPILALSTKETIIISGSEEMKKRPIAPLVDSLNNIGCDIKYIDDDLSLPLIINPSELKESGTFEIDGTLSSQYISGLMFGVAYLLSKNNNYDIKIIGEKTSVGFIDLTIDILKDFDICVTHSTDNIFKITNNKTSNDNCIYNVDGDATALSYLIGWAFLNKFSLEIENLNLKSNQSDINIIKKMVNYFGELKENNNKLLFTPFESIKSCNNIKIDLDSSDTFLTWCCLFVMEKSCVNIEIANIANQNWKECARIDNFISNLELIGGKAIKTETGLTLLKSLNNLNKKIVDIPTFNDHRFAMAFSLISMKYNNYTIQNPHCVSKTYPMYWEDMKKLGLEIIPIKPKTKNIVLIGMPGSGKSTLAKLVSEELNIEWIDTDNIIIQKFGPIKQLIEEKGWEKFRSIESFTLLNSLDNSDDLKIISTGGGAITNVISRNLINSSIVIYIKGKHTDMTNRTLDNDYNILEIERKMLYENLSDYIYYNNMDTKDFIRWLKLIITKRPIPNKSFFLCKTNTDYETNISNAIELRGDMIKDYGLDMIQQLIKKYNRPIIYTLRTTNEGGQFDGSNKEYINLYKKAIKLGCQYVDIEVNKNIQLNNMKVITIGSVHSNDINYINNCIEKFNYDIIKIVTNLDNCNILETNDFLNNTDKKIIIDNMDGSYRIKNNFMTPISSTISEPTARNQLDQLTYIDKSYKESDKKFLFLFGNNIGNSPSSFIHNYVIKKNNIKNIEYLNFETNDLQKVNIIIEQPYFLGASVTMPFKETISSSDNTTVNAINTLYKKNRFLVYNNTDSKAIIYFLKNQPTTILGTGGAAIGAINACLENGIRNINIVGRNTDKLNKLKDIYNVNIFVFSTYIPLNYAHNIINCLPPSVQILKYTNNDSYIIDMAYGIHNIHKSYSINSNYVNGFDILYVQAALQFLFWFKDFEKEQILNDYKEAIDIYKKNLITYI